jgi:hypothetical protein
LIDFQRAVPEAAGRLALPWADYARQAAEEIEQSEEAAPKLPRLWQLLRATQNQGLSPRPLLAVIKVLTRSRTGFVHRPLRRALKDVLPASMVPRETRPDPSLAKETEHPGLLAALEQMVRESALPPLAGSSGPSARFDTAHGI